MAADYGASKSMSRELSHTSDDSSDGHTPRSIPNLSSTPATAVGLPAGPRTQPTVLLQRKPRGRPPGSKNKPKPPIIITKDSDSAMKTTVLEISACCDIIDSILNFARQTGACITVMSATGSVSNVTLRHPGTHAPSVSLPGPFFLLALFGSFFGSFATKPSSSSASGSASASSSGPGSGLFSCPSFGISIAGAQGQVFGGIVTGKLIAASKVVVVVATFLNPTFHRFPSESDHHEAEETQPANGGNGGAEHDQSGAGIGMSMSVYGVCSPSPINCHMTPDIMHWGAPSRPPY